MQGDPAMFGKFLAWQSILSVTDALIQRGIEDGAIASSELETIKSRVQNHERLLAEILSHLETLVEGER